MEGSSAASSSSLSSAAAASVGVADGRRRRAVSFAVGGHDGFTENGILLLLDGICFHLPVCVCGVVLPLRLAARVRRMNPCVQVYFSKISAKDQISAQDVLLSFSVPSGSIIKRNSSLGPKSVDVAAAISFVRSNARWYQ